MVVRNDEDVFLLALWMDQELLSNTFPAFPVRDGFLVPFGELCRLLDLAILAEPAKGLASGWFIQERRRFALDVLAGTVQVEGRTLPVDRSGVELHADDLYVDTRLIAQWLPIDLKVAMRAATLTVTAREPLPMQQRLQREREEGRLGQGGAALKAFPRLPDPYLPWELPMVDETVRMTLQSPGQGGPAFDAQSVTFATADFAWLSSSLFATVDSHGGLSDFRMAMGRRDPEGGLLGALHATEFTFGEVLDPGVDLVALPYSGTGLYVSNYPLQRANAFDRHSFQGSLPPGWQVELYRNQALVSFQASRADGRYEFLNVPLYFGWNDFRLVFYGPQGQRREEVLRFDVSENQTPQGEFQYRLLGDKPNFVGRRGQLEGRYGLTRQVAADVSLATVVLGGVRHTYTEAGLQGFWQPMSAGLTAVRDDQGGTATELSMRSRLGSVSLVGKRSELQGGFQSELFQPVFGLIRTRTSLDASALLPSMARSWFTVDLGLARDELVSGGNVDRLTSRIATSYRGFYLSNQVLRTVGRGAADIFPEATTGEFLASKFFRTFSLRAQAEYTLNGGRQLTALSVLADTPVFLPFQLRAGLAHSVLNHENTLQTGLDKTEGSYSLGVDLNYSNRSHLSASLTLRAGFGRDPRSGRIHAEAQSLAGYGAVSARAFLDTNGNGVKDPGEKALEGVAFTSNGAPLAERTGTQGSAFLMHLPGESASNLAVSRASLEDPLMVPSGPGVKVVPRPGHVTRWEVPVTILGEVTGTVYLKGEGPAKVLPGLALELVEARTGAVRTLRTAYDGFFDFTGIPPGDWLLRVSEAEARRLRLAPPPAKPLTLKTEGTILDGIDLLVAPAAVPVLPSSREK